MGVRRTRREVGVGPLAKKRCIGIQSTEKKIVLVAVPCALRRYNATALHVWVFMQYGNTYVTFECALMGRFIAIQGDRRPYPPEKDKPPRILRWVTYKDAVRWDISQPAEPTRMTTTEHSTVRP